MSTTDNGWPASKTLARRPFAINGVEFVGGVADRDDVELVLRYVLQRVADRVEQPVNPGCWGFAFRPNRNAEGVLSRHSGGIAVDLNAPTNPNGVPTARTWTQAQITAIHQILDELDEACGVPAGTRVVRWGGDFNGTPDSMHFEINVTPTQLPALAGRLRTHLEEEAFMATAEEKIEQLVKDGIAAAVPSIVKAVLDAPVDDDPKVTVRRALRRAGTPIDLDQLAAAIAKAEAKPLFGDVHITTGQE